MCDCYAHPCTCGRDYVEMHLGDFDTEREEIEVLCPHCPEPVRHHRRSVWWITRLGHPVMVVAKTENAHKNMEVNHPNEQAMLLATFRGEGTWHCG